MSCGGGQAIAVHAGDYTRRGTAGQAVSREQALAALAAHVEPCTKICRPDRDLSML
ncbi:DUF6233 domain-containing protein [Streptomyces sp. NPDC001820]|uniref:DUF6233 domain-containing protein n=1 Tax=Streptomyces sp. NPDC001820 TaxID=3364613 RepID=UPI0036D127B1